MIQEPRHPSRWIRWAAAGLGVLLVALATTLALNRLWPFSPVGPTPSTGSTPSSVGSADEGFVMSDENGAPLGLHLSPGQPAAPTPQPIPTATGEPLSERDIQRILARLPIMTPEPDDAQAFRLPPEPLPPPRPGETLEEPFPPPPTPATPPAVEAGPLEVVRYAPEGQISIAPFVSITFNQPMVPLTPLGQLDELKIPVTLVPQTPGRWRWIGTKTLIFEADAQAIDRLPKATEYRVTVPSGTRSMTGGTLAKTVSWTFTTPPPAVTQSYPNGDAQPLDPLIFIAFDQRVDPGAVLDTIRLQAAGKDWPLRLASQEEVSADKKISRMAERAGQGRWLALRVKEPLPADTLVTLTIGPGTPSAEGPLVTQEAQSFSFRTYAPLRVEDQNCQSRDEGCPPTSPLVINFNNPLDKKAFDPGWVRVRPEIPGAQVEALGNTLMIRGATQGRTTYRVTLDATLRDVFGQTLGRKERLKFYIGRARPFLMGPETSLVSVDPATQKPALTLYAVNHDRLEVQIYTVQPQDWGAYRDYLAKSHRQPDALRPPGQLALDETLRFSTEPDALSELSIDLSQVMDGAYGHFIVVAKPPKDPSDPEAYLPVVRVWVQVTEIGLDAFADRTRMVAWATALGDGAPLEGVSLQNGRGNPLATTGADGTARFELPRGGLEVLVARKGADSAILPRGLTFWDENGWLRHPEADSLRWYVFADRALYRPGEEVHIKGWIRQVGGSPQGDVGPVGPEISRVGYHVRGPQGNILAEGQAKLNAMDGFHLSFTLPDDANLGFAYVVFHAQGSTDDLEKTDYSHEFQIQEFRRPEFEVKAREETTGPYFIDGHAVVAVGAKYYTGGPLPAAEVEWLVTSSPSDYHPPNWPDFVFGTWRPWWWAYGTYEAMNSWGPIKPGGQVKRFAGLTDAAGEHFLRLDFEPQDAPQPYSVIAQATVTDVNRQALASTTSLLVHPAELYVGLRSARTFVQRGQPLQIDLIVVDLDGNPVADRPIHVRAERLEWKHRSGDWVEEAADVQDCTVGSRDEPVSCTFKTDSGGRFRVTAQVTDAQGRRNQSQMTLWVSGGRRPASRRVEQERVDLIPDQETYQPGQVAEILVQAPFSPAEGLLTVIRRGILYTERFQMDGPSTTLKIPIEEGHIPNLHVQVDLVGSAPRLDDQGKPLPGVPPRPAYASGQLNLKIPPLQRALSLEIMPHDREVEPGGSTTLDLLVSDASGEPVAGAELAVVVVDEAVLALSNYQLADPLQVFYQEWPSEVRATYGRASIILVDPLALAAAAAMGAPAEKSMALEAADGRGGGPPPAPIALRIDFNPLAIFAPEVHTDSQGRAQITISVPDNLTRYRIMVVAVDESNRFGSAEANLTARLPLMVRPSAPRFLNFGDRFELPVVLQNQTDQDMQVEVALQVANLQLLGPAGLRVSVPARDRVEVRFPAATAKAGIARIQVAAVSGPHADAAQIELPVYTPATTEAFAVYGVVDQGAIAQAVLAPQGVFPQFGALEITTSSTALQALTDAVLYLVTYPYECAEQLASRILAVAALRDVLTAFEAEGLPSPAEMEAAVARDIEQLQALQNSDGGFPYWRRGRDSIPFNTIHVALALQVAKEKGFAVPQAMQDSALQYLRQIESHYPSWYSEHTRRTLSAYALYVRARMGDRDSAKARQLLGQASIEEFSLDALGWLWQVLLDDPASRTQVEAIRRHVANRAVETAGAANFTTSYSEQDYLLLRSSRRTDAILLDALIGDNPDSDLIPKLVNGLLAHRERGRWRSTQENVFVLLALDRYFRTFEAQTPEFVARIWLGETYVGEHAFAGRSTERHQTDIPMAFLLQQAAGETQDLILGKEGVGRLYYRLGLRYAPTDLTLDPLDQGFVVTRTYEAVDDPEDVRQDEDGVWHIKAGARVRVRVTMVADNRRYHVALVVPLPAGLEILNPALATTGNLPQDPGRPGQGRSWWWWRSWFEHQNLRDERAEAFTPLLWEGIYEYSYIARATTPGTFVVPPAKAEEMYSPEVFGRSASELVVVE